MLDLVDVTVGYNGNTVLSKVDMKIPRGTVVALLGANGVGKTTLMRAISGLIPLMGGDLRFEGASLATASPASRVRRGLVHVPEGRQVFAGLTVSENLMLGAYLSKASRESLRDQALAILQRFPDLLHRAGEFGANLSGGQQQMLAIGRALMSRPSMLLLDEPSLGLAPLLVSAIFDLVRQLRDDGLSILLAEQNARMSLEVADYGYVLHGGHVVLDGPADQLSRDPQVAEQYLGGAQHDDAPSDVHAIAAKLKTVLAVP